MSDTNQSVESPLSTRVDSPSVMPISPTSAATALAMSHQDIAATVTIANSLIETVRRHERDFVAEHVRWEAGRTMEQNRLEFLEARLVEYLAQLREDDGPPPEYESNHDGKAPHYMMPIGENLYVEARWVRQLPNGFVAGLPKECTPSTTPLHH